MSEGDGARAKRRDPHGRRINEDATEVMSVSGEIRRPGRGALFGGGADLDGDFEGRFDREDSSEPFEAWEARMRGQLAPAFPTPGHPLTTPPRGPHMDREAVAKALAEACEAGIGEEQMRERERRSHPPAEPSIDEEARIEELIELLSCSEQEDHAPLKAELMRFSRAPLVALEAFFPGKLWFDPRQPPRGRLSGDQVSGLASLLSDFGDLSVEVVARLLTAPHKTIRFCATVVAADLAHPELAEPLFRVLLDADPTLGNAAMHALHAVEGHPRYEQLLSPFRQALESGSAAPEWRVAACRTFGRLRDRSAIGGLIQQLAAEPLVSRAAQRALLKITARDFGDSRLRWRAWQLTSRRGHRIEWLMDALTHSDVNLRTRAAHELTLATGREIEKAAFEEAGWISPALGARMQSGYRAWWSMQNPKQHRGAS